MAKTIVGLYDDIAQARAAAEALDDAGYDRDDISLVANASAEEYGRYFDDEGRYRDDIDHREERVDRDVDGSGGGGAAGGAGIGATIGGIGGLLMGLGILAIPGVGPALAAGPIASTLVGAGIGAAAGGLVGALADSGVPEEEAGYYAEGVRRGGSLVVITVADERANEVEGIMNRHDPVDIEERASAWRDEGWEGYDADAEPYDVEQVATERERRAVPVVEEDVAVGTREVADGGARIRSYVREEPVEESVTLRDEEVRVERRDVDRPVEDADAAFEEKTVEMTETREEAVVEKTARVTGEVVVEKDARDRTETISESVRRTEVEVEEIGSDARGSRYDEDIDVYRDHYRTTFEETERDYEHYEPAYRFGSRLAHEETSRDRTWADLEADAQRRWEERNPGSWRDYGEAVRYGYEQERGLSRA